MFLSERKPNGDFTFPKMVQLELPYILTHKSFDSCNGESLHDDGLLDVSAEECILQIVCLRAINPNVCGIGHLRIPRMIVTNPQFREELERYIPSLVLID